MNFMIQFIHEISTLKTFTTNILSMSAIEIFSLKVGISQFVKISPYKPTIW